MRWLFLVGAFLLMSCGGGGSYTLPAEPATLPQRTGVSFSYYGTWDDQQIAETANQVDTVWLYADDRAISRIQEAQGRGVTRVVLDVSQLVYRWTPNVTDRNEAVYVPHETAADNLAAYFDRLLQIGITPEVLYPMDEPDLHGLNDDQVCTTNAMIRRVAASKNLVELAIGVIFGDKGTPCLASHDIVGRDRYGDIGHALADTDAIALPQQKKWLVPGGACPWLEDPRPFLVKAMTDSRVWGIVAFIWTDNWGGTTNCGIRSAKTRPQYEALGLQLTKGKT